MEKFFYPGSFDPITNGHIEIVVRALKDFESGIIAIGENEQNNCLFPLEGRVALIHLALNDYEFRTGQNLSDRLTVIAYSGLTVDAAFQRGATHIIRVVRNRDDMAVEQRLMKINEGLMKVRGIQMKQKIYKSRPDCKYISSSLVKKLCEMGEYIAAMGYVCSPVHNCLMAKYLQPVYDCLRSDVVHPMPWETFIRPFMSRPYHNLSHIAYMLNKLSFYGGKIENPLMLKWAIFFHDFDQGENGIEASLKASGLNPAKAAKLFYATDHMKLDPAKQTGDAQIIHDLDLAILFDSQNYETYQNNVILEFAGEKRRDFAAGRIKVLEKLMEHLSFSIYPTSCRDQALENMACEVTRWQKFLSKDK